MAGDRAGAPWRRLWRAPSRWPVKWRLAAVSAALTLFILLAFALVVGRLASDRLQSDFRSELERTATELAFSTQVRCFPLPCQVLAPDLESMTLSSPEAAIRIVNSEGHEVSGTPAGPDLGPPEPGIRRVGSTEVATRPVVTNALGAPPVFVQYARDRSELDTTIDRLWLFLGVGVVVGTLLATLAGLAVAGRAMRPIASLTATARQIAATRDTSRRIPQPASRDEVAELAGTLDEMLVELDAARSETEQMVHAQREFVADASHELRTPLTSILANLELVQDRLGDAGGDLESEEMVASALRSSRRMRRLVGDLLLLARADAGRLGGRSECDLVEVAAAALSEVRPVSNGHDLTLRADGSVDVRGNADELHRLAVNLLENGVRHTPPGTHVEISVEPREDQAVLEVVDDGPGLADGADGELFARFVRGSGPADLSTDGGAGLGLAIVRAVASAHGGAVEAGAAPAGGARFTVRLPLAKQRPERPAEF